ncbi:MAG: ferric reductase-like transmembrane domain-containing protein [Rubrivivax sp.]|nr:ferric reductase-like transmembrane domain-containing protein [Rubrivivax sp.]
MSARTTQRAIGWLALYLLLVLAPVLLLADAARTPGRGFAWDFSMALGYVALAMFTLQWVLIARFKRATAPFGIDIVYYFHRYLAVVALALVVVHVALIAVVHPQALGSADPRSATAHMSAGRAAVALLVVVTLWALLRQRLGGDYDRWRIAHALLSALALAAAFWHLFGSGHYLDAPWKRALWVAYALAWVALLLYVRALHPWAIARAPWRVREVRPERGRVCTLVLEREDGHALAFEPGQFAWLTLRASPFAMREHPFSIASSAADGRRVELSIKALGDFSTGVRDVPPGERAWLDAPYGHFSVDRHPAAEGYVFVAGGIGIAPMMSMLRTLADRGDRRPLLLIYGNRAWERVAFREELEQLAKRLDLKVVHTLIEPPPGWTGERGLVTRELLARHLPPAAALARREFFVCGPTAMTLAVERALGTLGVPAERVHNELFDWV